MFDIHEFVILKLWLIVNFHFYGSLILAAFELSSLC
jgi:hypothetical protein